MRCLDDYLQVIGLSQIKYVSCHDISLGVGTIWWLHICATIYHFHDLFRIYVQLLSLDDYFSADNPALHWSCYIFVPLLYLMLHLCDLSCEQFMKNPYYAHLCLLLILVLYSLWSRWFQYMLHTHQYMCFGDCKSFGDFSIPISTYTDTCFGNCKSFQEPV